MLSFSTLKMRTKLILIVAVPLLGLLYFSISSTTEKAFVAREMVRLESLVDLSVRIGALTHELQKERGMTAGFLGSKGASFANELPAQRNETDKKNSELQKTLAAFDVTQFDVRLKESLDEVARNMAEIGAKRKEVSSLGIPAPEAVGFYTRTIGKLLDIPAQTPTLSSDSQVARLSSAYTALLQAKERAGQERAILAGAFAADKLALEVLVRFLSTTSAQETYTQVFNSYALDEQKAFYQNKISGTAVDEVAAIKKVAVEKASEASLGIDSKNWFKVATVRIDLLKEVEDKLSGDLLGTTERLKNNAQALMVFYLAFSTVTLLVTLFFSIYTIRWLLRQIGGEPDYASEAVHKIADGDLSMDFAVKPGDTSSLLYSLKVMQDGLRAIIRQVLANAGAVSGTATQLSASSTQIAKGSQAQSEAAASTAAAVEEITVSINSVAANTEDVRKLSEKSLQQTQQGNQSVTAMIGEISRVQEAVNQIAGSVKEFVDSTRAIAGMTQQVKEIADQTNLLALNAAIEAARAGEQGRGFAVVADEVRKLAEKSAKSASEIDEVTNSLNQKSTHVEATVQAGLHSLQATQEQIARVSTILTEAGEAVKESSHGVSDIAASVGEQSLASTEIARNVEQIAQMSEENHAAVESNNRDIVRLEQLARELQGAVSRFKV